MFCDKCGYSNSQNNKFCPRCGNPLRDHTDNILPNVQKKSLNKKMSSQNQNRSVFAEPMKKPEKKSKVLRLLIVVGFLFLVFVLIKNIKPFEEKDSGKLITGKSQKLITQVFPDEGETLEVDNDESPLHGMLLEIPEDAFDSSQKFTIKSSEIESHEFGDLFDPITPLINIEYGHDFAQVPMTLTIPIEKDDDEFAMGFYYDRVEGTLEAIPFTQLTNDSITLLTSHFSEIVVSKVKTDRIMDDIDTGFNPGMDDIQSKNIGSYIESDGHCAGQTFANIVYWKYHDAVRAGWDKPLNSRFDNVTDEKTLDFFWDDALVLRLSSAIHQHESWNWDHPTKLTQQYLDAIGADDRNTFYAFAYSMSLTGMPQMMYINGIDPQTNRYAPHAILAYGVSGGNILVCDPNFPGSERTVPFDYSKTDVSGNTDGALGIYYSGSDSFSAEKNAVPYDIFGYFGTTALIDYGKVTEIWLDAMENNGKKLIDPLFPQIPEFYVAGIDASGNLKKDVLTDNYRIKPDSLKFMSKPGYILIAPNNSDPTLRYYLYNKTTYLTDIIGMGADIDKWVTFLPDTGVNDLGILIMKETEKDKYAYVTFQRYRVLYGDVSMTVRPETQSVVAGDIVNFSTGLNGTLNEPFYVWSFEDGTDIFQGNLPEMPHMYEKEGTFTGTVSVREKSDPSIVLADASFTITVEAGASTPPPSSAGVYEGVWKLSYTYTSECQHSGGISAVEHGLQFSEIGGSQTGYMNIPMNIDFQMYDSYVTQNANGTLTIDNTGGQADGTIFIGTISPDGNTITGEFTETYGSGRHWLKGPFTMTR